ncbi:tRNA (N6-isopentenyl adenosine(37)-C2)-methylthiotransferase MiaB [Desulfatirhabdium butyrativorans]|uniref:tRNA (N6-isopentenyl adenosine(37)-C2)-methylthiotransferase MiaB n=1 Tax=Desulfatirhabdium butyrativorans TaxID=340467 RepID=UPI000489E3E6|nr:tRNA (N6-isopentenyl adenosine(37)-C2)-methylthiotransferase MiaB [Desulfatirhabdium butyrativorans]
MSKRVFLKTIGCQMNVYDSERMLSTLQDLGYESVSSAEAADLIIINTCAIRAKAEQKLYSFIGRLADLKQKKPAIRIGIAGCVAQQEGKALLQKAPCVDFVFGTHAIGRLDEIVRSVETGAERILDTAMNGIPNDDFRYVHRLNADSLVTRFVTIMTGCDNYCAYCVVPYVRGRETSREPGRIIEEIRLLVEHGVREITLLGQNVNSYGNKERYCSFAELLRRIASIEGLSRMRFTTSHPKDLSEELIEAFSELPKLAHHIHLPVQAGSDVVLKRMNRKYSRSAYLDKVGRLRKLCPDIAITTDIIVGFPGETESQFQETLSLMQEVGYDAVFAFQYSDRPDTPSSVFPNKIDGAVKAERLSRVLELQKSMTMKKHQALIGSLQEVLVEGLSRRTVLADPSVTQWTGRSSGNHIVHFSVPNSEAPKDLTGTLRPVRITRSFSHSLWGEPEEGA